MTWFEAYMLWNIGSIMIIFIPVVAVSCLGVVVFTIIFFDKAHDVSRYEEDSESGWYKTALYWKSFSCKGLKLCIPVAVLSILILAIIPSTETIFKIIATKKGIDAIQSDTASKYFGEMDKAVTNGMKVLNQEIEKKLDKKEKK